MFARRPSLANPPAVDAYVQDFQRWLLAADFMPAEKVNEGWQGWIHVDWEDPQTGVWNSSSHKVLIILPAGFPYHSPVILSQDDPHLQPSWHLSPEGTLCLWREPDGWTPFTSAQKLLERVSDWFRFYHTDGWPDDFAPTDLHLYLQSEGMVVIGEEWNPPDEERWGSFILWRNHTYPTLPCLVGLKNNQGKADQELRLLNQLAWIDHDVQRFHGVWFRVNESFVPGNRLDHLLIQIDQNSGEPSGTANTYLVQQLSRMSSSDGIPLAVGYPGIRGLEQWLFVWVPKPKSKKIYLSRPDLLRTLVVKSFETAPARKADLLRRISYLSKDLGSKKVAVFGVGALGSSVALLLAKAGLGEIRLIDGDKVKPVNVIRHVSGLGDVGALKNSSVKRSILKHNPDCQVVTFEETWRPQELIKIIDDVDLIIDTTANVTFSLWLNQLVVSEKSTILYAAAYRRAAVGRLVLYRGNHQPVDPCLACYLLNEESWDEENYPIISPDPTTTFEEEGCAAVTEEADAIHIEQVANQCALLAIKHLTGESSSGNLFLQVNEAISDARNILAQPGTHILQNSNVRNCPVCGGIE